MDYRVDLDPTHSVIRLTVTVEITTPELAEDVYICLARIVSSGSPFAVLLNLSGVTAVKSPAAAARDLAFRDAVREWRTPVVVALYQDFLGGQCKVVHSPEEAYDLVGVSLEDFTERLFPKEMDA
jgi:hypothetical protein